MSGYKADGVGLRKVPFLDSLASIKRKRELDKSLISQIMLYFFFAAKSIDILSQ